MLCIFFTICSFNISYVLLLAGKLKVREHTLNLIKREINMAYFVCHGALKGREEEFDIFMLVFQHLS